MPNNPSATHFLGPDRSSPLIELLRLIARRLADSIARRNDKQVEVKTPSLKKRPNLRTRRC